MSDGDVALPVYALSLPTAKAGGSDNPTGSRMLSRLVTLQHHTPYLSSYQLSRRSALSRYGRVQASLTPRGLTVRLHPPSADRLQTGQDKPGDAARYGSGFTRQPIEVPEPPTRIV